MKVIMAKAAHNTLVLMLLQVPKFFLQNRGRQSL